VIPYIDSHNHMHSLSHEDWELMAMTGLKGAVLSSGNPYIYREVLEEPPGEAEIMRHWNQSLRISKTAPTSHFIHLFVAAGISSMTYVRDCDILLEHLAEISQLDDVVAIGEVGVDPVQYFGMQWPLDDQRRVLREQFKIAKQVGKPAILHTPTPKNTADYSIKLSGGVLPAAEEYRLSYLKMDLEELAASGLDEKALIVDHTDRSIIEYVLNNTKCMVGISIGSGLRKLDPQDAARMVADYGASRIMLNSDVLAYRASDILAIPKTIRAMKRLKLSEADIVKVVFSNAVETYKLPFAVS
jgi:predicted metal-dependent TIM-barrel fold hydrolase